MAATFNRIKEYLDAVGSSATFAPHGKFWDISHADFLSQDVPGVDCKHNHSPIPIVDKHDFTASSFLKVLEDPAGFCGNPQMPFGGKKLTNPTYTAKLADGTV